LVAVTIFLQTSALYTSARPVHRNPFLLANGFGVLACLAVALLATHLPVAETLAVFGLAVRFDTVAAVGAFWECVLQEVVNFMLYLIGIALLIIIELI
jgi:hypothetical protein